MKQQCYDEGVIQAFLDGELASETLENVARHLAFCDNCSALLQDVEDESAFAFAALDEEFNTLVPTERIRTNLYQAIAEIEKPKVSFWTKLTDFSWLSSSPSLAAFASLLIVAGLFAVIWEYNSRAGNVSVEMAQNTPSVKNQTVQVNQNAASVAQIPIQSDARNAEFITAESNEQDVPNVAPKRVSNARPKFQNLKYTVEPPRERPAVENRPAVSSAEVLSGENAYIKTIATLNKTVDESKDMILSPSARVAFEKDLAIVNDAITKMKAEVRKNPKNEGAKTILRNSYQNKIDLLNSVAERSQTVAGLD